MAERVATPGTVSINAKKYRIVGQVRTILGSQYPRKLILGDTDIDSDPRRSLLTWKDWRGGLGLNKIEDNRADITRFFFSQCQTQFKGHLVAARLITPSGTAVSGTMGHLSEHGSLILSVFGNGTDLRSSSDADTYTNRATLGAASTDALHFFLAGTEYAAFAHTTGYTYSSNGTSWTADTTLVTKYMAFWDDRLWGIGNDGQLWFAVAIATETKDAQVPLPAGFVTDLFVGPDAAGEDIIYAATKIGLYAHDAANERFIPTHVRWPKHDSAGTGCAVWNGDIYIPVGISVYRYSPRSGTVVSMGLDRDDGLQSAERGSSISKLLATHNDLLALVAGGTNKLVYGFDNFGWHSITPSTTFNISDIYASDAISAYRLYLGFDTPNGLTDYVRLYPEVTNPDETSSLDYLTSPASAHITPWFDAGQDDVDKVALAANFECANMTADRTIKIEFALNYSSSFDAATFTITSDGRTRLFFLASTLDTNEDSARVGRAFRSIRFRFTLVTNVTTGSPDLISTTFEYRKKLPPKYAFTVELDLRAKAFDKSPQEMRADLIAALESNALVEFTFRNKDTNTLNYYVDVANIENVEETGEDYKGTVKLTLVEP